MQENQELMNSITFLSHIQPQRLNWKEQSIFCNSSSSSCSACKNVQQEYLTRPSCSIICFDEQRRQRWKESLTNNAKADYTNRHQLSQQFQPSWMKTGHRVKGVNEEEEIQRVIESYAKVGTCNRIQQKLFLTITTEQFLYKICSSSCCCCWIPRNNWIHRLPSVLTSTAASWLMF